MFDGIVAVYRSTSDVFFYVTGNYEENELILLTVLSSLYESISLILRGQIDRRTLLENLDYIILIIDELIDGGIVLETEPQILVNRVLLKGSDGETPTDQTISQVLQNAREQLSQLIKN
eukprot:TRINITY_DN1273_c0_g1_i1.p1 TRINITY_DN1273_c0_g1~~TRINITY_DN1273_c0_g1_i1.p1  ORF type:complete len:119 (-),score=8.92 TRINITY_DN1273_c0_g1_i1:787-1143(-)